MRKSFSLPPENVWDFTIVSPAVSQQITSLSLRQQDEAVGRFPRSVRLGLGKNGRKGRVLREIIEYNRDRIAERSGQAA